MTNQISILKRRRSGRTKKRAREGDDIYDPGSLLNTSQILILNNPMHYFYFPSFTAEEMEAQKSLPKVTQLVRGLSRMCSYALLSIIILLNNKNVRFSTGCPLH